MCCVFLTITYIAGNMSALLGVQNRYGIILQVISLGNVLQPFVFVVTLRMNSKELGQYFVRR